VESPAYLQGKVIFGSRDSRVYAYSTERACSILTPLEGDTVGLKEVVVAGSAVSEFGNMKVLVQTNSDAWEAAAISNGNWTFSIDPSKKLNVGLNTISCKVSDTIGVESGVFTTVTITRSSSSQLSNFIVEVSSKNPKVQEPLTVYVNDGDDGASVERFNLDIDGNKLTGNNNITLVLNESKEYLITVSKLGFNNISTKIYVYSNEVPVYYYIVGAVLLLVLLYVVFGKLVKK
jgi:hypothetical protein